MTVNMPCLICGSEENHERFRIRYPEHNYPGDFCIRECKGCGLLFNSPRIPEEQLKQLYDNNYYFFKRPAIDEFNRSVHIYNRTIRRIENKISEKRVLEIGSAKGYLLSIMQKMGWEVKGIEISAEAARYAVEKLHVDTFHGTIDQYIQSPGAFEPYPLVLAIDIIEHVPDPVLFIRHLQKIVKPGGMLIIDTPNGGSKKIGIEGSAWKGFNPYHISLFSVSNLSQLLTQSGFHLKDIFFYGGKIDDQQKIGYRKRIKIMLQSSFAWPIFEHTYNLIKSAASRIIPIPYYLHLAESKISSLKRLESLSQNKNDVDDGDNFVLFAQKE
ncbi:MAG: class I SAM-dependent methyltransferase [Thermodesulfobacteriota bacterium]